MSRLSNSFACALGALLLVACGESGLPEGANPFADRVVSFEPGEFSGFGEEEVVLGGPQGQGPAAGGLHVLSLGLEGSITLELTDWVLVDGEGPDLLVFENAFPGWVEPGIVEVSEDGETWSAFPCADTEPFEGCAGLEPVLANVVRDDEDVDPTDPAQAGGDAFDLADLGVPEARFVRITDAGLAPEWGYAGESGGFDLDAIAVVNGAVPE